MHHFIVVIVHLLLGSLVFRVVPPTSGEIYLSVVVDIAPNLYIVDDGKDLGGGSFCCW